MEMWVKERQIINFKKDLHHLKLENEAVTDEAWVYLQIFIYNLYIFLKSSVKMIVNNIKILTLKIKLYELNKN